MAANEIVVRMAGLELERELDVTSLDVQLVILTIREKQAPALRITVSKEALRKALDLV